MDAPFKKSVSVSASLRSSMRTPIHFGESRRKMLLMFKEFRYPGPGVPSYLVDESDDAIVFGEDRILIKKTRTV